MDKLFFGFELPNDGLVYIEPVKCADGKWRWCVMSFEDVREDTPAFISHDDPQTLFNTTDKMEHPENYGEYNKYENN